MSQTIEVRVPDIGGFKDVPVIDVLVKPGETIAKDAPLVVLESDKASMEVPSSEAGVVGEIKVKVGDTVSEGSVLITLSGDGASANGAVAVADAQAAPPAAPQPAASPAPAAQVTAQPAPQVTPAAASARAASPGAPVHASPAIRRFARELGVALDELRGSGPRGRITREDVQSFVKTQLSSRGGGGIGAGLSLPAWPRVDFEQFGTVERAPLSRIKKLSGPNLHRNWLYVPHITNYDRADVTDLEAFRAQVNAEQGKSGGAKLTMLAFLIVASVAALKKFPDFNASLDGDDLMRKRYYNIGFAADTPNGLMVPVLKNADSKGLVDIARETAELAAKARDGKLGMGDMQGGTFTISSIGGIGGTAFTQIVNAPEVAILGAVRTSIEPIWDGEDFVPRTMLPISVSYDHRVIDGAGAARFLAFVASLLSDFKRVSL
ncbi:MAG TPA: dihydrolipoyllysine-residue acetyltransferase [Candidatus Tumulicola sp.]